MPRRLDARTLEPSALHLLRRQVVQAIRGGMSPKLRKTIGRDLTKDERRRYGVPDSILTTKE